MAIRNNGPFLFSCNFLGGYEKGEKEAEGDDNGKLGSSYYLLFFSLLSEIQIPNFCFSPASVPSDIKKGGGEKERFDINAIPPPHIHPPSETPSLVTKGD